MSIFDRFDLYYTMHITEIWFIFGLIVGVSSSIILYKIWTTIEYIIDKHSKTIKDNKKVRV